MSTTTLEKQVAEAQAEHDEQQTGKDSLFDADRYKDPELAIPKVDGSSIDRIALTFSGTVFLDRSEKADVALYNRLRFGKDVTLTVEGRCNKTGAKGVTDRDGDLDVVVGEKAIKVHTVYLSVAEGIVVAGESAGTPVAEEDELEEEREAA